MNRPPVDSLKSKQKKHAQAYIRFLGLTLRTHESLLRLCKFTKTCACVPPLLRARADGAYARGGAGVSNVLIVCNEGGGGAFPRYGPLTTHRFQDTVRLTCCLRTLNAIATFQYVWCVYGGEGGTFRRTSLVLDVYLYPIPLPFRPDPRRGGCR